MMSASKWISAPAAVKAIFAAASTLGERILAQATAGLRDQVAEIEAGDLAVAEGLGHGVLPIGELRLGSQNHRTDTPAQQPAHHEQGLESGHRTAAGDQDCRSCRAHRIPRSAGRVATTSEPPTEKVYVVGSGARGSGAQVPASDGHRAERDQSRRHPRENGQMPKSTPLPIGSLPS